MTGELGGCEWCGCTFRKPSDAQHHCCAAMQEGYPEPGFPLTNTVEQEEQASWADREPGDPDSDA